MSSLTHSAKINLSTCVAMVTLSAIVLALRLAVRFNLDQRLLGSDWTSLASAVFFYAYSGLAINYIFNVSKHHAFDIDLTLGIPEMQNLAKLSYASELIFSCGITLVKLSIIWFYHTIFAAKPGPRVIIQVTVVVCILWFIIVTSILAFQCHPVEAYWTKLDQQPYCLETPRVLLGYEVSNLLIDVIILCIPIFTIRYLNLPTSKKVTLAGVFLLGALVCIASILRITAIWSSPNDLQQFNFPMTFAWSTVQLGLAIICGCLPTLAPLLPALQKAFLYLWSSYGLIKLRLPSSNLSNSGEDQELRIMATKRP